MVAVEGDPLSDLNVVIDNVRWVMMGATQRVSGTCLLRQLQAK
jgi:hypothetical protein